MAEEQDAGSMTVKTPTELGEVSPPVVIKTSNTFKERRVEELRKEKMTQEQDSQLTGETPPIVRSQEMDPIDGNTPQVTLPVVSPDSLLVCTASAMGYSEEVRIHDYSNRPFVSRFDYYLSTMYSVY